MSEFKIENLEEIIKKGDFDALIGKSENFFFECKQEIYDAKNDSAKCELAKDISSFANLNGGYILIGPQTKKSESHFRDEVEKVKLFKQNLVDVGQYLNIAKDWVYPEIERLEIVWKPSSKDRDGGGIVFIHIPPQKDTSMPFLLKKIIEARKYQEIIFGYIERREDRSDPRNIQDIHRVMRDGLLYDKNIESRFNTLELLIKNNQEYTQREKAGKKNEQVEKIILERIDATLKVNDMDKQRVIVLIAYINNDSRELSSIFSDTEGSIRRKLENPPKIRYAGWDLGTLDRAKIIEGRLLRVMNGNRKTIDLYRDGTLIFAGLSDEDFLCWANKLDDLKKEIKINSLALIELIYSFLNFYKDVLADFNPIANKYSVKFGFKNLWLNSYKNYMVPGQIHSIDYQSPYNKHFAPKDEYFSEAFHFEVNEFELENIAYEIVKEIYLWFGISPEGNSIPYTKTKGSKILIDKEQIVNIR